MSTIITRNSANSGSTPSSLVQGELAINVTDGRLFYGSGSNEDVKEFTPSATPAGPDTSVQFNDGGATNGTSDFTFDKTTGLVSITTASIAGLYYPTADGIDRQVVKTDGAGNLEFGYPDATTVRVVNSDSVTILKGYPVHATSSGTIGELTGIILADAGDIDKMPATAVLSQDLDPGEEGEAILSGYIRGVNTTGFTSGEVIYVAVGGGYTQTKPTGSAYIQNLGVVTKIDPTNGAGIVFGAGRSNDLPNVTSGYAWVGNSNQVPTATPTASFYVDSASFASTASYLLGSIDSASYASTASYVNPLTQDVIVTGSLLLTSSYISSVDYIDFNNTGIPTPTDQEGRIYWDEDNGTLSLGMHGGQVVQQIGLEDYYYVKNQTGTTILNGTVTYASGTLGASGRILADLMVADGTIPYFYTLGITTEDIVDGDDGYVTQFGLVRGINTTGSNGETWNDGDVLYVSPTVAGTLTKFEPEAPNLRLQMAIVVHAAENGSIFVRPDIGSDVGSLHDVIDTTTTASYGELFVKSGSVWTSTKQLTGSYAITGSLTADSFTGSLFGTSSWANNAVTASYSVTASYADNTPPIFIDNLVTVGLPGSNTNYNTIKEAVDSITDSSATNTYTVQVGPGIYIEDEMTVPEYVAVKGDSSISTVVSASNPSASIFNMSDQSMVIDMQIQGSTAPGVAAVVYQSDTTPQTYAISYVENVRFGTNYTNAKVIGSGSANIIMQCSNVKYGGFTDASIKTFDVGFHVTNAGSGIGRMQLRNVTSTNGGITGSADQIFGLSDAPGCAFIVNGCLLTRSAGSVAGTGFKVYNGGALRLTGVNWQRWTTGIWAPQTGSAPSINAIALNFENCTTDVLIEHTGSTGKVQGTDNFLKTDIALDAPLYEVGQDPRRITVAKKGGDFTSIASAVDWISGSAENNRFVISVGPGQFTEPEIDLTGKPYVSIVGSNIQTTEVFPSASNHNIFKIGINNEISFLSVNSAGSGYAGVLCDDIGDFAQLHKVSFYDCDTCVSVLSSTQDTYLYGEYVDYNGVFTYGTYVSASNGFIANANMDNYYVFPVSAGTAIANYATGPSSSLTLYSGVMRGESEVGSMAIYLQDGADLQAAGVDFPDWNHAIHVGDVGIPASFNIVGCMIHGSVEYDFFVEPSTAVCRFQGTAAHEKISNSSDNFYWSFLDESDGEFDITNNLAVTFADGTHTDASTLIFRGSTMGVLSGGVITVSGSLDINVSSGTGYAEKAGSDEVYVRLDWPSQSLTLPANSNEYVYFTSAGTLTSNTSFPSSIENVILGRVVTNDTTIEFIDQTPVGANHTSNEYSKLFREALGPIYAFGSIVSENATAYHLDVTSGEYYYSSNEILPAGGTDITFTQYYISGSGWNRSTTQTVPSNVYASGSVLTPMSASYYTKHTLYVVGEGVDEMYMLVVNDNQYASLVSAEDAALPTIPTYFSDSVVSLAAIYVRSGSANIVQIQDTRPTIGFRAAGVNASSVHANLLGLTADDHQQYLLVDGTRAMGGNLNMGTYDITNAGTITGTLAGTASWAENSITASYLLGSVESSSYAETASYALTAQTLLGSVVSAETASYINPLVQNVQITGSVDVLGGLSISSFVLDTSGLKSANFNTRLLSDSTQVASINWDNRQLISNNNPTADWDSLILYDANTSSSIDWGSRGLIDETETVAIFYSTSKRSLNDTAGNLVLNFRDPGLATFDGTSSLATTASYALTAQTLLGSVVSAETASYILGSNVDGAVATATTATTASYILGSNIDGAVSTATTATQVSNAATFNNGGAGAASGTTFDGSAARTISYNTIGAPSTSGTNATGTWSISVTGNAATATTASYVEKVQPRTSTVASSATPTPNADTTDIYTITALATGATLGAPTGTPVNGQKLTIRILDNGSAQTLAYNAIYRAFGTALPTTTTISKTLYLGCIYNSADATWDVVAVTEQV